MASITTVPVEIILEIIFHLDDKSLFRFGGFCKHFRSIIHRMTKGSCRRYLPALTVEGIWQFRNCLTEPWKLAIDEEIEKHSSPTEKKNATEPVQKVEGLNISKPGPDSKKTKYLIKPERVQLYQLLSDVIKSKTFTPSRPKIVPFIKPFDRAAYLAAFPDSQKLPELFKRWILEYPSWAIHSWKWPGLALNNGSWGPPNYAPPGEWFKVRDSNELSIDRPMGQCVVSRKLFLEYGDQQYDMLPNELDELGYGEREYDLDDYYVYINFNSVLIKGDSRGTRGLIVMLLDGIGHEHFGELHRIPMGNDGIFGEDLIKGYNGWGKWRDWVHFLRRELEVMEGVYDNENG